MAQEEEKEEQDILGVCSDVLTSHAAASAPSTYKFITYNGV